MLKAKLFRKGTLLLFAVCLSVLGVVTAPQNAEASGCCTTCYEEYDSCLWDECVSEPWQSACPFECAFTRDWCLDRCNPAC